MWERIKVAIAAAHVQNPGSRGDKLNEACALLAQYKADKKHYDHEAILFDNLVLRAIAEGDNVSLCRLFEMQEVRDNFLEFMATRLDQRGIEIALYQTPEASRIKVLGMLCADGIAVKLKAALGELVPVIKQNIEYSKDLQQKNDFADLLIKLATLGYSPIYKKGAFDASLLDELACINADIPEGIRVKIMNAFFSRATDPISPDYVVSPNNERMLAQALHDHQLEIVECLLKAGADTKAKTGIMGPSEDVTAFQFYFKYYAWYNNPSTPENMAEWNKAKALCRKYAGGIGIPESEIAKDQNNDDIKQRNGNQNKNVENGDQQAGNVDTKPGGKQEYKVSSVAIVAGVGAVSGAVVASATELVAYNIGTSALPNVLTLSYESNLAIVIVGAAVVSATVGAMVGKISERQSRA